MNIIRLRRDLHFRVSPGHGREGILINQTSSTAGATLRGRLQKIKEIPGLIKRRLPSLGPDSVFLIHNFFDQGRNSARTQ